MSDQRREPAGVCDTQKVIKALSPKGRDSPIGRLA